MNPALTTLVIVMAGAAAATSQNAPQVVKAHLVLAAHTVHQGSRVKAAIEAEVAPGYHINDHHPTLDYLIPTQVLFEPSQEIEAGEVSYPKGKLQRFGFLDRPISVYEGKLVLTTTLSISKAARPGQYMLKGKLSYQACNDRACLPPASVPLSAEVTVVGARSAVRPANGGAFGSSASR